MLEVRDQTWSLLRCPRSGQALERVASDRVESVGTPRFSYPVVSGVPILVDFSRSVIDEQAILQTAGKAQIERVERQGVAQFLKRLVSPVKASTRANIDRFIACLLERNPQPRVLVIGGGTIGQGLDALYQHPDIKIVAFDIYYTDSVHFIADGHSIPIADATFDGVVIQAVLEHVLQPEQVAKEIWRVLKERGVVYAETPFMQHVHEGAYDFTRFTESGHRYLFRCFDLIASGSSSGAGMQLLWSLDYFARCLFRSRTIGKTVKLMFFWLQFADLLIPEAYAVVAASGVFFLGYKSDREMSPKEIVHHYLGAP